MKISKCFSGPTEQWQTA